MQPTQNDANVEYHVASLAREADAQRLADAQRRHRRPGHGVHPGSSHDAARGVRVAVGRFLIGLGTAIAGSNPGAGARPMA